MTVGYVRISTEQQDAVTQRQEILEYVKRNRLRIDRFIEIESWSAHKSMKSKGAGRLLSRLKKGDALIVSELSRLGRSIIEVISNVNDLANRGVRFIAIKQGLDLKGPEDAESRVTVSVISLLADLERDLISNRTRKALAVKREQGVILGRPRGSLGKSKLDSRKSEIIDLLKDRASYSFMARRFRVSLPTVINFIKSRRLRELAEKEQ
jgi:DNA invertase Pin-like site-specific DNA recombinase